MNISSCCLGGANPITTGIERRASILSLIKDTIAVPATIAITRTGTRHDIINGARSTNLGHTGTIDTGSPNGRSVRLGGIATKAGVGQDHAGTGTVHDGPTDAAALLDVVAGIKEGGGDVVDEAGGYDHHSATILKGRASVRGEDGVDNVR